MKDKLNIHYDEEGDFLELRIGKPTKSYYEEIKDDIFERRDERTNKVKGLAIFNFKKRTKNMKDLELDIPFEIKLS